MTKNCFLPFISTFYFFLFLLTVMASCQQEKENSTTIVEFPQRINLTAEIVDEVLFNDPLDLLIEDSLLIILNSQGNYFIQYYNKNTFQLLGEYGTKGRGPGEFINPEFTGQSIKREDDKTILIIFDWTRRNINYIDVLKSLGNQNYISSYEKIDSKISSLSSILFNNDSLICVIPEDEIGRFILYDKINDSIKFIPFIPQPQNNIHSNHLYYVFGTLGKAVLEKDQIFLAMPGCMGQLDYFDFNGKYLKSIVFDKNEFLKEASHPKDIQTIDGFKYYQTRIRVVKDKIFILFNIRQWPDNVLKSNSRILELTSQGEPLKEYILDKEISRFEIDTLNNYFIGYNSNSEELRLLKFKY